VIGDLLFGILAAAVATAAALAVVLSTWYVLPLRRSRDPRVRSEE